MSEPIIDQLISVIVLELHQLAGKNGSLAAIKPFDLSRKFNIFAGGRSPGTVTFPFHQRLDPWDSGEQRCFVTT